MFPGMINDDSTHKHTKAPGYIHWKLNGKMMSRINTHKHDKDSANTCAMAWGNYDGILPCLEATFSYIWKQPISWMSVA